MKGLRLIPHDSTTNFNRQIQQGKLARVSLVLNDKSMLTELIILMHYLYDVCMAVVFHGFKL